MNLFNGPFAAAMAAFGRVVGDTFQLGDAIFPAICIEELTVELRAMLGGRFRDARSRMLISKAELDRSGIKHGAVVKIRGEDMRISAEPEDDGTGSYWVPLGPVGVNIPRR